MKKFLLMFQLVNVNFIFFLLGLQIPNVLTFFFHSFYKNIRL